MIRLLRLTWIPILVSTNLSNISTFFYSLFFPISFLWQSACPILFPVPHFNRSETRSNTRRFYFLFVYKKNDNLSIYFQIRIVHILWFAILHIFSFYYLLVSDWFGIQFKHRACCLPLVWFHPPLRYHFTFDINSLWSDHFRWYQF